MQAHSPARLATRLRIAPGLTAGLAAGAFEDAAERPAPKRDGGADLLRVRAQ